MRIFKSLTNNSGNAFILFLFALMLGFLIGALCWPYTINTWLVYFGKTACIKWWQGGLIGFVPGIGHFGIIAMVVTWITMMFLG